MISEESSILQILHKHIVFRFSQYYLVPHLEVHEFVYK